MGQFSKLNDSLDADEIRMPVDLSSEAARMNIMAEELLPPSLRDQKNAAVASHRDRLVQAKHNRPLPQPHPTPASSSAPDPSRPSGRSSFNLPWRIEIRDETKLLARIAQEPINMEAWREQLQSLSQPEVVSAGESGIGIPIVYLGKQAALSADMAAKLHKVFFSQKSLAGCEDGMRGRRASNYDFPVYAVSLEDRPAAGRGRVVAIHVRDALSVQAMASRKLLELLHFSQGGGWMKVCCCIHIYFSPHPLLLSISPYLP